MFEPPRTLLEGPLTSAYDPLRTLANRRMLLPVKWTGMPALTALAACHSTTSVSEATICPKLAVINPASAANDARLVPFGQEYLLGVFGYTTEVPGAERENLPVRMIVGTSDSECRELNARAREYATRFNRAMQSRLR